MFIVKLSKFSWMQWLIWVNQYISTFDLKESNKNKLTIAQWIEFYKRLAHFTESSQMEHNWTHHSVLLEATLRPFAVPRC